MTFEHFKPAPDYAGLVKQARAMHMLIKAQSGELSMLRARDYALREQRLARTEAQVESERAVNALLTEENEALVSACGAHLELHLVRKEGKTGLSLIVGPASLIIGIA